MYESRKGGHLADFDSLWNKTKDEAQIVNICQNGKWMDLSIFENV